MSTYKTGTVTVTNGSTVVTGSGTAWAVALVAGGMFSSAGVAVPIASVTDDTHIVLDYNWPGTTATGAGYSIALENAAAASVVSLNTTLSRVLVTLSLAGITPDASGSLTDRAAITLGVGDKGFLFLHAEIGVAFAFYRWTGTAWDGPFPVANSAATGGVSSLVAGTGVTVDNTNPAIPVVKMANMATSRVKGRATAGTGAPEDLTLSQVLDMVGSAAQGDILYRGSSTWTRLAKGTALQTLRQNGALTAPEWATAREVLTANRTYYVLATGSDSNTGLVNSAGGAFQTMQKAMDVIAGTLDLAGFTVTVQIGDGTYTTPLVIKSCVGMASPASLLFQGNTTTPSNVVLSTTSATAVTASGPTAFASISCFKIQTTTSGMGVTADSGAQVLMNKISFGAVANYHVNCFGGAYVSMTGNYTISGNATFHIYCSSGAFVFCAVVGTVTLTGTLSITTFAYAEQSGIIRINGNVYSGSVPTGSKYNANSNANIFTNGAGATYLPGSTAGATSTGGNYT
ncbi:hypothetical protein NKI12_26840 [Mesorhizobium australicum]|uniref:Uncharacterized protein n=1 Tax=Mesorhizobium australicum TaxID=536018 RepID=A0ACC6T6B2_9HYPH